MGNMLKGPQVPPLYDTLMGLKKEILKGMRCCIPGNIVGVDLVNGTVDVEVAFLQQDSNGVSFPYPKLTGCPAITLQGGGIAAQFPVEAGDECLVFFADRCIDSWFQTGSPQPLPNLRMHDISDGFALVGVNSLANALDLALLPGEGGFADDKARVAIMNGKIAISNDTKQLATILGTLVTTLTALNTTLASMTTASIAAGTTQTTIATYTTTFTGLITDISDLLYP